MDLLVVEEVLLTVQSFAECLAAVLDLLVDLLQTLRSPTERLEPPHGLVTLRMKTVGM